MPSTLHHGLQALGLHWSDFYGGGKLTTPQISTTSTSKKYHIIHDNPKLSHIIPYIYIIPKKSKKHQKHSNRLRVKHLDFAICDWLIALSSSFDPPKHSSLICGVWSWMLPQRESRVVPRKRDHGEPT